MWREIEGKKYLMRDERPLNELKKLYWAFVNKYNSKLTFVQWLVDRGKVYCHKS